MVPRGRMITQPTAVAGGQPRTINDLPPEIFYEIIPLAALQVEIEGYYDRLRFLRLVATSWSALIDNHPKFWTTIRSSDYECVWRMALQRSKAAEIDVDAQSDGQLEHPQNTLIKTIVDHMSRVRSLRILDRDFGYLVANASAAPRLRSLSSTKGYNNRYSMDLPFHPAKWAPNLRDVDLVHSGLIWKGLQWNNLEHLRIYACSFEADLPLQDIFTILKASPGLRSLDLTGIIPPGQHPLPIVKLEALESLLFEAMNDSPVEALNSIVALPTARCNVCFDGSNEARVQSTLQSICKLGSGIIDGEAGRKLKLVVGSGSDSDGIPISFITMGGFVVDFWDFTGQQLNYQMMPTQLFKRLPPSRREAVTTVEIGGTDSDLVPTTIIHSFFPNASHLTVPRITKVLETALGRSNEGWLFPHLETLFLSHYDNRHGRLMRVVKPRLEAAEAGEHVARIKTLSLELTCGKHVDEVEIAELEALVPNVVVKYPVNEENSQSRTLKSSDSSSDSE